MNQTPRQSFLEADEGSQLAVAIVRFKPKQLAKLTAYQEQLQATLGQRRVSRALAIDHLLSSSPR